MRVLLRSCSNGDQYVWKKAEMKDAKTFALEDGNEIPPYKTCNNGHSKMEDM